MGYVLAVHTYLQLAKRDGLSGQYTKKKYNAKPP